MVQKLLIYQSRNLGDVTLSLPMIGFIKQQLNGRHITLVARAYTQAIAESCEYIDDFIDWEALRKQPEAVIIERLKATQADAIIFCNNDKQLARLAKVAAIPQRIGSLQKLSNWAYCNKLLNVSKRLSHLHEAQINIQLLKPLGVAKDLLNVPFAQLSDYIKFTPQITLRDELAEQLCPKRFNVIIHPGSLGHGREWPPGHFIQLIQSLDPKRYQVLLTGQACEAERFAHLIAQCPKAINLMGTMTLPELIAFMGQVDGLIASGTGTLHMAAALGIYTLGLFPPRIGISPRRWAPVGKKASYLVFNRPTLKACWGCRDSQSCPCMAKISTQQVKQHIEQWIK